MLIEPGYHSTLRSITLCLLSYVLDYIRLSSQAIQGRPDLSISLSRHWLLRDLF
jgi:hypothetical protein